MIKQIKIILIFFLLFLTGCVNKNDKLITISFKTNGGSLITAITIKTNEEVNLPTPTRDGYTFKYWYDIDGKNYSTSTKFSKDTTLYAHWEINEYLIKFFDYDNTLISEQKVKYNKNANKPNDPIRNNYVFIGWDQDFTSIKSDLNIYALYEEATDGLIFQQEAEGYIITGYEGNSQDIIIPHIYKNAKVYAIESNAFAKKNITSVQLPDTITTIGHRAFLDCSNLKTINIPKSVLLIDEEAFMNCTSLSKIIIPATTIGKAAFYNCTALSDITILDSVTTISEAAFYNCARLKSIYIPESVTSIGANVISWCQNLEYIYTTKNNVLNLKKMFDDAGYIYVKNVQFVAK